MKILSSRAVTSKDIDTALYLIETLTEGLLHDMMNVTFIQHTSGPSIPLLSEKTIEGYCDRLEQALLLVQDIRDGRI